MLFLDLHSCVQPFRKEQVKAVYAFPCPGSLPGEGKVEPYAEWREEGKLKHIERKKTAWGTGIQKEPAKGDACPVLSLLLARRRSAYMTDAIHFVPQAEFGALCTTNTEMAAGAPKLDWQDVESQLF